MQDGFNTGGPVKAFLLQLKYAARRGFKELSQEEVPEFR
jgi:hypothetical protein